MEQTTMTPKNFVLRGYQLFAEGDVEGFRKINRETHCLRLVTTTNGQVNTKGMMVLEITF